MIKRKIDQRKTFFDPSNIFNLHTPMIKLDYVKPSPSAIWKIPGHMSHSHITL